MDIQHQTADAREAEDMGEKPDMGRTPDALTEALAREGMASSASAAASTADPEPVKNTGEDQGDPAGPQRGEADTATG